MRPTLSALLLLAFAAAPLLAQDHLDPRSPEGKEILQLGAKQGELLNKLVGQMEATRKQYEARTKPLEDQLTSVRAEEHAAENLIRAKMATILERTLDARIGVMNRYHPGAGDKLAEGRKKVKELIQDEGVQIKALQDAELKEFGQVHAKYQAQVEEVAARFRKQRNELVPPPFAPK